MAEDGADMERVERGLLLRRLLPPILRCVAQRFIGGIRRGAIEDQILQLRRGKAAPVGAERCVAGAEEEVERMTEGLTWSLCRPFSASLLK
jgi:hypothetical protein